MVRQSDRARLGPICEVDLLGLLRSAVGPFPKTSRGSMHVAGIGITFHGIC